MTISNQACDNIDEAVDWTAVTRMFNLRDAFELIHNTFDNRPFAQQEFVHQRE